MFIKRLDVVSDTEVILNNFNRIIDDHTKLWQAKNQVSLTHRLGSPDIWADGTGSLYDGVKGEMRGNEGEFNQWNIDDSWYVRQQVENLKNTLSMNIGRVRFMRLLPKCGLTIHNDNELRYHLVLKTNPRAYIAQKYVADDSDSDVPTLGKSYHLPLDGHWYQVDTRRVHWVYNGGKEERIHLVVCGV